LKVELYQNNIDSDFPFFVETDLSDDDIADTIDKWCKNNIGEFYVDWILYGISGWAFKNYDDALQFILTWS
jgi:hypothetical protein